MNDDSPNPGYAAGRDSGPDQHDPDLSADLASAFDRVLGSDERAELDALRALDGATNRLLDALARTYAGADLGADLGAYAGADPRTLSVALRPDHRGRPVLRVVRDPLGPVFGDRAAWDDDRPAVGRPGPAAADGLGGAGGFNAPGLTG